MPMITRVMSSSSAQLRPVSGSGAGVGVTAGTDLVGTIFGNLSPLSRAVYILVGLAGLYQALQWKAIQHRWQLSTAS